jgi:hypothetical protein
MPRRLALLGLPALLAGCASAPTPPSATDVGAAPEGALHLDRAASLLRIVAFRGGSAPRLGHHHILQAAQAEGWLWLPEQGLAGARGLLRVPLAMLQLDDPDWRRAAGGEFDEKPLSPEDIAATRRNLLSALQAEAHPLVSLELRALRGAAPWVIAEVAVRLAGREALYTLPLDLRREGDALRAKGRLLLRHSAHGLAPYSILGGLLAVQDEVLLAFDLLFRSSSPAAPVR